ncbi:hypothetical protein E4U53_008202 [Claviceps sorghi]|nr:hypothetical protein E4U53_008202 [Claviceps sorghi]
MEEIFQVDDIDTTNDRPVSPETLQQLQAMSHAFANRYSLRQPPVSNNVLEQRKWDSRELFDHYTDFAVRCASQTASDEGGDNLERLERLKRLEAPEGAEEEATMLHNMALLANECHGDEEVAVRSAVLAWTLNPRDSALAEMAIRLLRESIPGAGTMDGVCAMCRGRADVPREFENHTSSMDCGHVFHTQCFMSWKYILNKECPICHPEGRAGGS